jgi:amidase
MKALDDGLFTSVELTRAYLARIDEVNNDFRAVTEVNPDALDIAAQLDSERAEGRSRG